MNSYRIPSKILFANLRKIITRPASLCKEGSGPCDIVMIIQSFYFILYPAIFAMPGAISMLSILPWKISVPGPMA